MQMDRRPNRGPYLAALVCLLTLCLAVPCCWRSGVEPAARPAGWATARPAPRADFLSLDQYAAFAVPPRCDATVDTLDELLSQLANEPYGLPGNQPDLFAELIGSPESAFGSESDQYQYDALESLAMLTYLAGRELAQFEPGQRLVSLVDQWRGHNRSWQEGAESSADDSLILTDPNDRLMMLPRDAEQAADAFPAPWCLPSTLIARLELLASHPYSADWAQQAIIELRELTASDVPNTAATATHLQNLTALAERAVALADETGDDLLRAELLRAHWGLTRRLACWSLMRDIAVASVAENRFATRVPWDSASSPLAGQASVPADLHALSANLEAYEASRSARLARTIRREQQQLAESGDSQQRVLADRIEQNYRNANVRLALSAELLERFVSDQSAESSPVRDRIVGTPVRGQSLTTTDNRVKLHPDPERWRVDLESDGTVDSDTISDGGQVQLHSAGTTTFTARKSIVVDRDGVELSPSTASAHNNSLLLGVRSSVDWVPVVNEVVRSQAIDRYRQKRSQARAEVEWKVANRVEQQLDERADEAVNKAQDRMREKVTGPLESVGIDFTPIELSTTKDRVIARLRIARPEQLAGHTPRPRAPSDSLASAQIHESALTNLAASLGLDGKRLTAEELQKLIRERFSRPNATPINAIDADTIFEFAAEDAVRFRVADQKLELILAFREVNHERNPVRNFRVHAFYVAVIDGLEARFARQGALGIEGRIGTGERARMHGVFNKVLSEERTLPIVRLNDPNDQRLSGLMITQLVLDDGWIGLAIGPASAERTAELTRMLR